MFRLRPAPEPPEEQDPPADHARRSCASDWPAISTSASARRSAPTSPGQGIRLPTGSISALCDRFLTALEALHWERAPALRTAMPHGHPLQIDATCDRGRGGTFLCLAGWTG